VAGITSADAVVGLLISLAILRVLVTASREIYRRLMDSVDPELIGRVDAVARAVDGVRDVTSVRIRWIGHDLHAAIRVTVDPQPTVTAAHDISEAVHHQLLHDPPPQGGDHPLRPGRGAGPPRPDRSPRAMVRRGDHTSGGWLRGRVIS